MNTELPNSQRSANELRFSFGIIGLLVMAGGFLIFQKFSLSKVEIEAKEQREKISAQRSAKRAREQVVEETRDELSEKRGIPRRTLQASNASNAEPASAASSTNQSDAHQKTGLNTTNRSNSTLNPPSGLPETSKDEMAKIREIRKKILANSPERREADMKPYHSLIPQSTVRYSMVPIKSGEFLMGSPDSDPDAKTEERPQHKVKLSPFWIGQYEVTWNEYELFMYADQHRRPLDNTYTSDLADIMAIPTKPYVEMTFGMGKNQFPAISMTQHAANKYCQWLSAKVGHFYRVPTEAEWEYACRAGTTTAYSFGDSSEQLAEHGWFADNSTGKDDELQYHQVGTKKPNPWGLYDMHGNVAEWVLDQFDANYYKQSKGTADNPWNKATKLYPQVVRGGGFDSEAGQCRSASRLGSHKDWKMQDPQLPQSPWFLTDAKFVGMRIVRSLRIPSPEEMFAYWNSGLEGK